MNKDNVRDMFEQAVEKFATDVAISHRKIQLSYEELDARSNSLANYLLASNIVKGSVVAILLTDPIEVIQAILAIVKAGCVFAPLDVRTPAKRLQAMASIVQPEWFVAEASLLPRIDEICSANQKAAKVICTGMEPLAHEVSRKMVVEQFDYNFDRRRKSAHLDPDDMSYIYFTSGSTGMPKAIAGRLKGIDHFIRWEIETLGIERGSRVSQLLPFSFDGSLRDIFVPLCSGGTVCVPESKEIVLEPRKLSDWIDEEAITLIHCVPSIFRSMINEGLNGHNFQALRYILLSGEPLLPQDVKKWIETVGERIRLVNLYGTSETTMAKFIYFVEPRDIERRSIPVGKPMPGARAMILDESRLPCPPGVVGEIYIRTPYRTLGYYNQPELTREVFVQNPFSDKPADIVHKTGDLGRVQEDGNFEYLGRKDQQVKIRGVRVEITEIEDLLRRHPAIKDVVVVARVDTS
ncbi:MAG: amino acid adenylation domain-containing protein, partial [Blastocatellia bacterium]